MKRFTRPAPTSQRCGKEKAELNFHHAPAGTWVPIIRRRLESTRATAAACTNENGTKMNSNGARTHYFITETHSLLNAHSLLPSQLTFYVSPPVRSILTSLFLLPSVRSRIANDRGSQPARPMTCLIVERRVIDSYSYVAKPLARFPAAYQRILTDAVGRARTSN